MQCGSYTGMLEELEKEVVKNYDTKPIIVIYAGEQLEDIKAITKRNKLTLYEGVS